MRSECNLPLTIISYLLEVSVVGGTQIGFSQLRRKADFYSVDMLVRTCSHSTSFYTGEKDEESNEYKVNRDISLFPTAENEMNAMRRYNNMGFMVS